MMITVTIYSFAFACLVALCSGNDPPTTVIIQIAEVTNSMDVGEVPGYTFPVATPKAAAVVDASVRMARHPLRILLNRG